MKFNFFFYFILLWLLLNCLDWLLNKYVKEYSKFLDKHGLSFSYLHVSFYTTFFNRYFYKLGNKWTIFLKIWFNTGVFCSLFLMFFSIILLFYILFNTLMKQTVKQQQPILTPIMPGVNLPNNQLIYFFSSLFLCAVLHEVGHAIAAVSEEVKVNGSGMFVLFIYPGAFVDLNQQQLEAISPFRQLKIFCAGVWHNISIVIFSFILLLLLPSILSPLYYHGDQVHVTSVIQNSVVSGDNGIEVGNKITWLNDCRVRSSSDWLACIQTALRFPINGFCVNKRNLTPSQNLTKDLLFDCCSKESSSHLCFHHQLQRQTYDHRCLIVRQLIHHRMCLEDQECHVTETNIPPPYMSYNDAIYHPLSKAFRKILTKDNPGLFNSSNIVGIDKKYLKKFSKKLFGEDTLREEINIDKNNLNYNGKHNTENICIKPTIGNYSRLLVIHYNDDTKKPLIFLGYPYDLYYSVSVSDFSPKLSFLPPTLPSVLDTFLKYLISLSGALAIMNIVPCYALDGQWITKAIFNYMLPRYIGDNHSRNVLFTTTISFGSILVFSNVIIALWSLFVR